MIIYVNHMSNVSKVFRMKDYYLWKLIVFYISYQEKDCQGAFSFGLKSKCTFFVTFCHRMTTVRLIHLGRSFVSEASELLASCII